jgi:hypothetical protein
MARQENTPASVIKPKKRRPGRPKRMGRPVKRTGRMKAQVMQVLNDLQEEVGRHRQVTLDMVYQRGKFSISKRTLRRILAEKTDFLPLKQTVVLTEDDKEARVEWCKEKLAESYARDRKKISWLDEHTVPKLCSIRCKIEHEKSGVVGQYVPKGVKRQSKEYYCKRKKGMAFNYGGSFKFGFLHVGGKVHAYPLTYDQKRNPFDTTMAKGLLSWVASHQGPQDTCMMDNDPRHWAAYHELPVIERPHVTWQEALMPDLNSLDFSLNNKIDIECRKDIRVKRMGAEEYQAAVTKVAENSKVIKTAAKKAVNLASWRRRLRRVIASGGEIDEH